MKKNIAIIGAGGHGRVCAEIAGLCGYRNILFLDDSPDGRQNVSGNTGDLYKFIDDFDVFVAVGDNATRKMLMEKVAKLHGSLATLIHPNSVVSTNASIGDGTVVMAGAVINTGAKIGKGVIINTCSSVDHDCCIGDYCHLAVGAHLAGTVTIGNNTSIGAGATVINNISINENVVIGACAAVVSDIYDIGTYVGVPARKIK